MPTASRTTRLRQILAGDRCLTASSLFDPMSARIADDIGFEVGVIGGSVASMAVLGDPDLILLTLSELAEQARRVCRAGRLCVIVDADHGYGNALNVMRTVQELQAAGVAGLTIEDTLLPRAYGTSSKPGLVSIEEGIGKMRAALQARADAAMASGGRSEGAEDGIVVFGRTSATTITGVDDAIRRVQAYQRTGVDAIFLVGVRSRADLEAIAASISLPIILGGAGKDLRDPAYLAQQRVRVCLQGHQPFMAAVRAVHDTLAALRNGAAPEQLAGIADDALMKRVTRGEDYARWSKDWL